jgi:O-antigen/teichoic acid export membrane protein
MGAKVLLRFGSFVLVFFIARHLEVTGFGVYSTVFLFYTLTSFVSAFGLNGGYLTRELARNLTQTNRYFIHAGVIALAGSISLGLLVGLLIPFLGYTPETTTGIRLVMIALPPTALRMVNESIFLSHQRAEFATLTSLLETLGKIGSSLWLLFNGYGVLSLILAFVLFSYIGWLLELYFLMRFFFRPRWEFEPPFVLAILRALGTFALMQIFSGSLDQVEVVILSLIHGETAVGIYAAASKLIMFWQILPENYMSVMFPLLSQAYVTSPAQLEKLQQRSVKYLLALACPLLVGTLLTAKPIIALFYGDGYEQSVLPLQILSLILICSFLEEALWRLLIARDRQDLALKSQIIGIIFRVAAALALVPVASYVGTALALLVTFAFHSLLHIYYLHQIGCRIPFFRLGWRFGMAAMGMGGVLFLAAPSLNLFVTILLGVLVYAILVLLFKAFSPEDFDLLRRIVRPRSHNYANSDS